MNFLILEQPSPSNLADYIATLKLYRVTHVVRVHDTPVGKDALSKDFTVLQGPGWSFADGGNPTPDIIKNWLHLVDEVFELKTPARSNATRTGGRRDSSSVHETLEGPCIAIHCAAGLGRAPLLVAVALMERSGKKGLEAIDLIRTQRKGCFNDRQVHWLTKYRAKPTGAGCCSLM